MLRKKRMASLIKDSHCCFLSTFIQFEIHFFVDQLPCTCFLEYVSLSHRKCQNTRLAECRHNQVFIATRGQYQFVHFHSSLVEDDLHDVTGILRPWYITSTNHTTENPSGRMTVRPSVSRKVQISMIRSTSYIFPLSLPDVCLFFQEQVF